MLGSASELYHATREINAAHQAKAHPLEQSQEFESNVLGVGRVVKLAQIRTIEFKPRTVVFNLAEIIQHFPLSPYS